MIYLFTAIILTPGGSSTVHIYTQTIHRTIKLTNWEQCGPCPRLYELYPGICLTTEETVRKNLSQGSRLMLHYMYIPLNVLQGTGCCCIAYSRKYKKEGSINELV